MNTHLWNTLSILAVTLFVIGAMAEGASAPEGMVRIAGGTFEMGSTEGWPHEQPVHTVKVDAFYLDTHEVTNAEFAKFVEETGYVTEAEQWKWSLAFLPHSDAEQRVVGAEWWVRVDGADWRHPSGPDSSIVGKDDLPVVQVSWNDAVAYAKWAGKRLPTEAEWEFAARGGKEGKTYPWGDEQRPDDKFMMNAWSGTFPTEDTGKDGHAGLAPVGRYPANGYGLYDMAGNVWEWCADWYGADYYAGSPVDNPAGPDRGGEKIMRGGSWLCNDSYCTGYRVSHRNKAAPDSGLTNTGFRCAKSIEAEESKGAE
jgi:formylglycine-generating enzyme required for sulfatase activity